MSNFRINLRRAIIGCPTNTTYFEQFSTEELHRKLGSYQKQAVVISILWVALLFAFYFMTGEKENVLFMFIISGGTTIWLTIEDFQKRRDAIRKVLRGRK